MPYIPWTKDDKFMKGGYGGVNACKKPGGD